MNMIPSRDNTLTPTTKKIIDDNIKPYKQEKLILKVKPNVDEDNVENNENVDEDNVENNENVDEDNVETNVDEDNVENNENVDEDNELIPDKEVFVDPSIEKMNDLHKLAENPPKIPVLDILTVEPKATIVATKLLDMVISKLSDPTLAENIMDNLAKSVELSLENKINKIEYLKKDTEDIENNKDTSKIINDIHNETVKPTEINVKGGRQPFFTEQDCSFF
jgi:hypothetical protein